MDDKDPSPHLHSSRKSIPELIDALRKYQEETGSLCISELDLVRMACGDRAAEEHEARHEIILDIIKAKRALRVPMRSKFFKDVWPRFLEAWTAQEELRKTKAP